MNSVEFLMSTDSSHDSLSSSSASSSEDLPQSAKEAYGKLVKEYDNKIQCWIWLPNVASNKTLDAPSGIVVQVAANSTPIRSDLFSNKMFQGTSLYKIPKGTRLFGGKEILTEENVIKNLDRIKELINSTFKEEAEEGKGISTKLVDYETGKETRKWSTEMGSGGSYVGLFVSNQRGAYNYEQDFWIGLQTYSPSANKEIRELMGEAEQQPKVTWEKFFSNENKNMAYLQRTIKRNRAIQTAAFANAIGLENPKSGLLEFEEDLEVHSNGGGGRDGPTMKLNPTVETITNTVEIYKGNPVYRCGAIDPSKINSKHGGVIINENPYLGPTILKGPYSKHMEFGKVWEASSASLGSFPINTGRIKTVKQLKTALKKSNNSYGLDSISESYDKFLSQTFVWSGSNNNNDKNLRLIKNAYKTRDNQFKMIESRLGYDHKNGEINLKPLVVKIASTDN